MDRRTFLKTWAGFSFGLAGAELALPTKAKCKMVAPIADVVAKIWLDRRIKVNLQKIKQAHPGLKMGDTHCHSVFSDGTYTVPQILHRASDLGLDFLILTEHVMPRLYPFEFCMASMKESWRVVQEWNHGKQAPVEIYPAFEVSTLQGHMILVLDPHFFKPGKSRDLVTQFSRLSEKMVTLEETAKLVQALGGISILPHPDIPRSYPFGVPIEFAKQHLMGLVDGIEDISTGHGYEESYSEELGMASIGSSDDHFNIIIGTSVTGYDSSRHHDLISAVKARGTQAIKVERTIDEFMAAARLVL